MQRIFVQNKEAWCLQIRFIHWCPAAGDTEDNMYSKEGIFAKTGYKVENCWCWLFSKLLESWECCWSLCLSLQWRHNGRGGVSNHQTHHCLLNSLFRRRSKKTSQLRVTGLCASNSPVNGEFPALMASNAENVCIWWRHHVYSWISM